MLSKQTRVKIVCDSCQKETEWEIISESQNGLPDFKHNETAPPSGWITGYDITGGGDGFSRSVGKDFCSLKCLLKATKEYFEKQ